MFLTVLLAACAAEAPSAPEARRATATPTPATPTPAPEPSPAPAPRPLPPPIGVAPLPERGLAVADRGHVAFLDMDGNVVDRVGRMILTGNNPRGTMWLARGRAYFRLDFDRHELVPVPRGRARDRMYGEEERWQPDLPPPPGSRVSGRVAGHWRHAFEGPGGTLLAQWSGECEVPHAYWIAPGERAELVTGGRDVSAAPTSFGLGWADDGRALVFLPRSYCGTTALVPGIYLFSAPGEAALFYETSSEVAGVRMWE